MSDPRLYIKLRSHISLEEGDPDRQMADQLSAGIEAQNDSVATESRRKAEARNVRIGRLALPILRSADDFVHLDPVWVNIQAQEADVRRRELLRERIQATRERRDKQRPASAYR
jgi:hypothetical protein